MTGGLENCVEKPGFFTFLKPKTSNVQIVSYTDHCLISQSNRDLSFVVIYRKRL